MRLIVLTENPSLLLGLGSIRPDWEIATANSPSELAHVAARAAVGLMDLGTTQRGLDQVERMKEAGVTLPWVLVGDAPAPEEAKVTSVLRPFILANLAEELERSAGVTSNPAPISSPETEIDPTNGNSPRLLRRMRARAWDKKEPEEVPKPVAPKPEPPSARMEPSPAGLQPRWKMIEPGEWKSELAAEVWAPEAPSSEEDLIPESVAQPDETVAAPSPEPDETSVRPGPAKASGYLPPPQAGANDGAILPSRRGFRERFVHKHRSEQSHEGNGGYEVGPSGYPAPPPALPRMETSRVPKLPRRRSNAANGGNGHVSLTESQENSLQDMIQSASGAATALENLLQQMPGLEDPSVMGRAIVAEAVETFSPDIVALYAASPNGTFILIASYGLTKTEERMIVPGDHPFFREIASLKQSVMVSPVDLVQGLVAGIAGARTEAFMAAPFIDSGKCVAILVVGGDLTTKDLDRLISIKRDGTQGLALSLRLATLSNQAVQRSA